MILVDTNIWLALALSRHSHHLPASHWFEGESSSKSILFCRATQQSFLRLLTTAAVLNAYGNEPLTNHQAWLTYEALIKDDRIGFGAEPTGMESLWFKLAARQTSSPKLWMDAYLAAFAITAGYELLTTDHAFSQFPNLKVRILTTHSA